MVGVVGALSDNVDCWGCGGDGGGAGGHGDGSLWCLGMKKEQGAELHLSILGCVLSLQCDDDDEGQKSC